ncbi:hypothetical protein [Streptomyces sp. NPDC001348]
MTSARRAMTALRRSALLFVPAVCALTSCGIPTTGVVQAGGPASGVVPMTWLYFVLDGHLTAVSRRTDAPGDVESALRMLLLGPTDAERSGRLTTRLPLPAGMPPTATTAPATTTADPTTRAAPTPAPTEGSTVRVVTREGTVSVRLSASEDGLSELAAAQIICTAVAAERVADPGAAPGAVTVTGPDGRRVEGSAARCPHGSSGEVHDWSGFSGGVQ